MSRQRQPKHPIREVLKQLCGGQDPPSCVRGYHFKNLDDKQYFEVLEWIGANCPISWTTLNGIMEAAVVIVEDSVSNGNIPVEEHNEETKRAMRMLKRNARGLTLFELLIFIMGIGAIAFVIWWRFNNHNETAMEDAARAWGRANGYVTENALCMGNSAGTVRCTLRVRNREDPFALECNTYSGRCALAPGRY